VTKGEFHGNIFLCMKMEKWDFLKLFWGKWMGQNDGEVLFSQDILSAHLEMSQCTSSITI
jgi:hypothetical protein